MYDVRPIMEELGVSEACAVDVAYLRTRHRHTEALEQELIALHEQGTPPNMGEFGVTPETQRAIMATVMRNLREEG